MKIQKRRLPRKLKKSLRCRRPWWVGKRLESHYQHIFNPSVFKDVSFYSKYCTLWSAYDWLICYPTMSIRELYNKFGGVTEDMVNIWNNAKFKFKYLYNVK